MELKDQSGRWLEDRARSLCARGRELSRLGEYQDAEQALRMAISEDQTCFEAFRWLEYALDAQEKFNEASAVREWSLWLQVAVTLSTA